MSDIAIRVENLSKQYRLGAHQTPGKTLREALVSAVRRPLRRFGSAARKDENKFWALDGVSFEVEQGQAVGIIGRNGAGKSTLLKILSRITRPTRGRVELYGRVGSLLEVGTGFHSELSGRENIYLNGAILGMRRAEIERKFDEIVAFSEIEKFLDTPLKHYSSGMYVRLAFAVAAHLEPEILIVDEVLAVGDALFQKKSLGKMDEVTRAGRTVLFVSHNMGIIRSLCERTVLLVDGRVAGDGPTDEVISHYFLEAGGEAASEGAISWEAKNAPGVDDLRLCSIRLLGNHNKPQAVFDVESPIRVEITYRLFQTLHGYRFILHLINNEGITVLASTDHRRRGAQILPPGEYRTQCEIPAGLLKPGPYQIKLSGGIPYVRPILPGEVYLSFTVEGEGVHGSSLHENWPGIVAPALRWTKDERIEA